MASFHLHLLPPFISHPPHKLTRASASTASEPPNPGRNFKTFAPQRSSPTIFRSRRRIPNPTRATINGDENGATETKKPARRGRKKGSTSTPSSPSSSSTATRKTRGSRKSQAEKKDDGEVTDSDSELEDYDDGIEEYESPPLICCFGAAQKEFVPTVRVSDNPMHPDIYSQWKMLQWDPPEFVRAPGGPPSNVAISHVRLGGRAAFMGKVGGDDFGDELVLMMNQERVQTRAVRFDKGRRTGCARVRFRFDEEEEGEEGSGGGVKMKVEVVEAAPEDSLRKDELNLAVLKEVKGN